ncbi:uncharacterized protein LOC108095277 [Drosophila ficusphila]|uniref:uncharacterized protein LOC108095277 n=1 Tax=Drosophila ficusphila TaxID=30025 RepID=UPI0007E71A26|nr:uncharacterized protein LOC108095277 [Drosophila ficusphila]
MAKATKLRFALITEDVLERLRRRSQSENARSKYMEEIYTSIRTAVNEAVDEKLQQLSSSLSAVIEDKVSQALEQQGTKRRVAGGRCGIPEARRLEKRERERDSKVAAMPIEQVTTHRTPRRQRHSKRSNQMQEHPSTASDDLLAKRTRSRVQKITVMPIHRENPARSSPSSKTPPLQPSPTFTLTSDRKNLEEEDDEVDFSDVEQPSILTLAAQYLKKIEDSRRRKHHQHSDH